MLRELVSNNVFVFTSELYAQVTAGGILTSDGAIVIDTLAFPSETRQIIQFIEQRHETKVRYVVNTHYHADHTYGTCFFDDAIVISHRSCRDLLDTRGRTALENAHRSSHEMQAISLRLPDVVFQEQCLNIHLGGITVRMWHTPGHSPDSSVCLIEEEGILFAADLMTPVPFFADGNWYDFVRSLESIRNEPYESIIQGHGEVILRGEVQSRIDDDLSYLHAIRKRVEAVVTSRRGPEALDAIDIEDCGKSRIALNGLVQQLHRSNLAALYWMLLAERGG